jgi:hypothetical protein
LLRSENKVTVNKIISLVIGRTMTGIKYDSKKQFEF